MGKTAMPIIWFFTKISSVVSERLNTPVLNIVVHLEFHSNKCKKINKNLANGIKYGIILIVIEEERNLYPQIHLIFKGK